MLASRYFSLLAAFFVSTALLFAAHSVTKPKQEAAKPGPVHFEDIARQAGLNAVNVYGGATHKEFIIETTGNGALILDYDNDGWPDIFLPNGSTVNGFAGSEAPTGHLYHNNHDGTFTDVTQRAGLARAGWGQGGCVGDYDNDGFLDVLLTYWGQNALYHNNGNGTFTDVTKEWNRWIWYSSSCWAFDYDNDSAIGVRIKVVTDGEKPLPVYR